MCNRVNFSLLLKKKAPKKRASHASARMDSTMSGVLYLPHELVPPLGPSLEGLPELKTLVNYCAVANSHLRTLKIRYELSLSSHPIVR